MKLILSFLIVFLLNSLATDLFAQTSKPFVITKPFKNSTYDGTMIKNMKPKEVKKILLSTNNADVKKHLGTSSGLNAIGYTTMFIGDFIMLYGVATEVNTALVAGGAGVVLLSTLFLVPASAQYKKAVHSYNESIGVVPLNVNQ